VEVARGGLAELYALQAEAEDVAHRMAAEKDPAALERLHKRYDAVQHELQARDAYNLDYRVDEVLQGLGFQQDDYDRQVNTFSGGQQSRVLLARLLLSAPDLMLLDEPTNHLDIQATEWLEQHVVRCTQAMILVSHDRFFLDRTATRILELYDGAVADYPGNFSTYWKLKEERNKVQQRTYEKQQEFIARTEDFIRRNHYSNSVQAHDREKKLERLERVDRPREIPRPPMAFGKVRRAGDVLIDAVGLSKSYDDNTLFEDLTLRVQRGDRIGIFGANGTGKSTLLKCLLGELPPDSGTVRFGTNVDVAYYDQQLSSVDPKLDLVEAIRPPNRPDLTPGPLRDLLARFGLRGEIVQQQVGSLSGGEKSKTALARLAALDANLLILDEPTNHLDLWALAALESALREFEGTVLFVSHDRYFLDQVATSILALQPGRHERYYGTYSDYADSVRQRRQAAAEAIAKSAKPAAESKPTANSSTKRKRRFPYRKVEDLEAEIAATESRVAELEADLGKPEVLRDGVRARQVQTDYSAAQAQLARLFEHWEEAVELNG
jgi:ATP-binding cassette subfamily F protein 3